MKYKIQIISVSIFSLIFFGGICMGISPFQKVFDLAAGKKPDLIEKMNKGIPVKIPAEYIDSSQYSLDILHYDLNIDLYPDKKILSGTAEITGLLPGRKLKEINLNFYDNMRISSLKLNGLNASYTLKDTRLTIDAANMASDTFRVNITYDGTPRRAGLSAFVFGEINRKKLIYNLNEPNLASTWFPCNDIPTDKALLDISITNDSIYTSVSNGILKDVQTNGARRTYHWKTVYPISTYLVCVYSGEYMNFSQQYISQDKTDTMNIEYYVLPEHLENAKKDFEDHPAMIDFFSKTFGEYPFIKEKYGVAEFLWQLGAMEHQTITGIGSNFVSGRKFYKDIYVHELAHHWWGDAIGPASWKDIWLNEGFATYSEALYFEGMSGKKALQSTMRDKFQDNFTGVLGEPGDYLFSTTVYDKGAWVLHMLRWEIGDQAFFKLLREYFKLYKYKNASTSDFKELAESVSGKKLDKFFEQWVYGKGIINLEFSDEKTESNGRYIVNIDIKQVQKEYKEYHFPLEIEYVFKDKSTKRIRTVIDSAEKRITAEFDQMPESVIPDPDSWLLALIKRTNEDKK
jgi:aminopeptidase N